MTEACSGGVASFDSRKDDMLWTHWRDEVSRLRNGPTL